MTTQSLLVKQNWTKAGNAYVGDTPAGDSIEAFLASKNTAPNSGSAIWASSQVTDGNGAGTFADPYSLRGAVYSASVGSEVVLKDDGVYQLTNPMNIEWDYGDTQYPANNGGTDWDTNNPKIVTMNIGKPTQESERITIRGEQGKLPTIDCQQMLFCFMEQNAYMTFRALNFTNAGTVFSVFSGCNYAKFDLISVDMVLGGDNSAPIKISNGGSEYGSVTRYYVNGPGLNSEGVHGNTCGIYNRINHHWTYRYCTIHNIPNGIIYKHPNNPAAIGGSANVTGLFENIHIYDTDYTTPLTCNGYTFRNIVFDRAVFSQNGGPGGDGVTYGGGDNLVDHCITGKFTLGTGASVTNGPEDGNGNVIKNCIIGDIDIHRYTAQVNTNQTDYNLYSGNMYQSGNLLTLAQKQANTEPANQDGNSLSGFPTYLAADVSEPSSFALQAGSLGEGSAELNNNIGLLNVAALGVMGA